MIENEKTIEYLRRYYSSLPRLRSESTPPRDITDKPERILTSEEHDLIYEGERRPA